MSNNEYFTKSETFAKPFQSVLKGPRYLFAPKSGRKLRDTGLFRKLGRKNSLPGDITNAVNKIFRDSHASSFIPTGEQKQ